MAEVLNASGEGAGKRGVQEPAPGEWLPLRQAIIVFGSADLKVQFFAAEAAAKEFARQQPPLYIPGSGQVGFVRLPDSPPSEIDKLLEQAEARIDAAFAKMRQALWQRLRTGELEGEGFTDPVVGEPAKFLPRSWARLHDLGGDRVQEEEAVTAEEIAGEGLDSQFLLPIRTAPRSRFKPPPVRTFYDVRIRRPAPPLIVAQPVNSPPVRRRVSGKAVVAWFRKRVATWPSGLAFPSEADDLAAAIERFGVGLTRGELRQVVSAEAPEGWRKPGRRTPRKPAN